MSEKYGWLFAPKVCLFWTIKQWGYDWGYSRARIEIMLSDTVILDTGDGKGVSKLDIEKAERRFLENTTEAPEEWGKVKNKYKG